MNTFVLRTLTSFLLSAVFLVVWWFSPYPFGLIFFVSLLVAGLLWEYQKLAFHQISPIFFRLFFLFFSFLSYLLFSFLSSWFVETLAITTYLLLFFSFWFLPKTNASQVSEGVIHSLLGLFYVSFPSALFVRILLYEEKGKYLALLFLCIIFAGDTLAYLAGSCFGKRKWIPMLSPNKTWEGLFSGLITSGLVSAWGFSFIYHEPFFMTFLFGVFCFFIAQTGDLFISLLKRRAGVKDTGLILPGHGGLLDRTDGLLMSLPFMYLFSFVLPFV